MAEFYLKLILIAAALAEARMGKRKSKRATRILKENKKDSWLNSELLAKIIIGIINGITRIVDSPDPVLFAKTRLVAKQVIRLIIMVTINASKTK